MPPSPSPPLNAPTSEASLKSSFGSSAERQTLPSSPNVASRFGNGSKSSLESRRLGHRREARRTSIAMPIIQGGAVDQLQECIDKIKHNPADRRISLSPWNSAATPEMTLPPCHMMYQFYVHMASTLPTLR
ncbi:hypothetical protein J3R83DRAFT_11067 [Lanmaoa asiatica]|nr:hypothetical protein J3R83DRAFT_11067 [Lanmaoa asiatica]